MSASTSTLEFERTVYTDDDGNVKYQYAMSFDSGQFAAAFRLLKSEAEAVAVEAMAVAMREVEKDERF